MQTSKMAAEHRASYIERYMQMLSLLEGLERGRKHACQATCLPAGSAIESVLPAPLHATKTPSLPPIRDGSTFAWKGVGFSCCIL